MKWLFWFVFFTSALALAQGHLELRISLSPAGHFVAQTNKVTGYVIRNGNTVKAQDVTIDLRDIDSGIALRNKHMKQRLQTDKYPNALLISGEGANGKGKATIKVKNITKMVEGTYKFLSNNMVETHFRLKMSDFNIKDVSYLGVGAEDELEVVVNLPLKAPPVQKK